MVLIRLLGEIEGPQLWAVYGLAILTIVYIAFIRPMRKKSKDPLNKPPSLSLSSQRAVEREMNSLLVDLSEMARQVSAQLDNRARKLQILMEEADKKIERLSILAGKTVQHEEPAAQLRITPAEPDPPAAPADLPPSPAITQRHGEIYLLADEGKTPMQIATLLNRPRGEIELILALRPRKKAQE